MTTLIGKARTLILGNAHSALNAVMDWNSIPVLEQNVRDLETSIEKVKGAVAEQDGTVIGLQRQVKELSTNIDKTTEEIRKILAQPTPNENLAREKAAKINGWKTTLTSAQQELVDSTTEAAQLHKALSDMNIKHTTVLNRVLELKHKVTVTKGKNATVKATEAAGALLDSGMDSSIDNVAARINHANDVATARFNTAMGGLEVDNTEADANVNDLLDSLRPETAAASK